MNDGIRDELRELLFDSAPAPAVDTAAMFERTFAAVGPGGADLLPPDGLFDLPADDPADELPPIADADHDDGLDDGLDGGPGDGHDGPAVDDLGDLGDPGDAHWDADADADPGAGPDAPIDDHGTGAGW